MQAILCDFSWIETSTCSRFLFHCFHAFIVIMDSCEEVRLLYYIVWWIAYLILILHFFWCSFLMWWICKSWIWCHDLYGCWDWRGAWNQGVKHKRSDFISHLLSTLFLPSTDMPTQVSHILSLKDIRVAYTFRNDYIPDQHDTFNIDRDTKCTVPTCPFAMSD